MLHSKSYQLSIYIREPSVILNIIERKLINADAAKKEFNLSNFNHFHSYNNNSKFEKIRTSNMSDSKHSSNKQVIPDNNTVMGPSIKSTNCLFCKRDGHGTKTCKKFVLRTAVNCKVCKKVQKVNHYVELNIHLNKEFGNFAKRSQLQLTALVLEKLDDGNVTLHEVEYEKLMSWVMRPFNFKLGDCYLNRMMKTELILGIVPISISRRSSNGIM